MADPGQDLLVGLAVHIGQGEPAAGRERADPAGADDPLVARLFLLDPPFGDGIAIALARVAAGIVVQLQFAPGAAGDRRARCAHIRGGLQVVIVPRLVSAGGHGKAVGPVVDRVPILIALDEVDGPFRDVLIGSRGIGHDQGMPAACVPELVEDAFLFHQPRDEVKAGLSVLDAVLACPMGGRYPRCLEIGDAGAGQHFFDDLLDRLFLKDPAVGLPRQQPNLGNDLGGIIAQPMLGEAASREAAHQTVEVPPAAVAASDAEGDELTENPGCIEGRVLGQHFEVEAEQPRQGFLTRQRGQDQCIGAERRVIDGDEPLRLLNANGHVLAQRGLRLRKTGIGRSPRHLPGPRPGEPAPPRPLW